jgi:tricorn protease interacting factor F2/3
MSSRPISVARSTDLAHDPGTLRVETVDWSLDVHYREKTFSGRVKVAFRDAPDPLVIDADRLTIESVTLDGRAVSAVPDVAHGTLSIAEVTSASHVLEIGYRGAASPDSLVGLYTAPCGPGYVLTTMLFPTGSRRLLPTFEHPAIKTVYRFTLTTDAGVHAVFNTPITGERTVDGRTERTFAPTPRMSAYLLYLGIGPFDTLTIPGGRWSATVDAAPGRASAGRYAAERATEILAAYEEYYGIPYPLPKLDLIALENFWAGAMENWGAIACRDDILLVDGTTSVALRRRILATLSHEIAHQWFGNLVTNAWWDDFWLNESFATFVGYALLDRRYPSEEAGKELLTRWVSGALDMDGLATTHPIHGTVDRPDQLGENADLITYGKGAAVLRMMEGYLGEATFRAGISHYLRQYQYANARAEDLWNALGEVARQPVARILTEWVHRPGFPVVHARWSEGTLHLRQERFLGDGNHRPGVWPIPFRLRTADGEHTLLFETAEVDIPVGPLERLRLDPGRLAFVRLDYEGAFFDRMLAEFPSMAPVDQWGFVVDLHAFVLAGSLPPSRFLDLLRAARTLTDDLPLRAVLNLLGAIRLPTHGVQPFEDAARSFLTAQIERVGPEARPGEPESLAALRELLVNARVRYDLPFARELAARYAEFDRLPADLRDAVAFGYGRTGGPTAFEELARRLRTTDRAGERTQMLRALAATEDPPVLTRVLELIPGPGVTASGAYVLLLGVAANPTAGGLLFDWYRAKVPDLTSMWAGTPLQSEFLHASLVGLGLDREEAVRAFFAHHTPPDSVAGAGYGLESLGLAMRLRRTVLAESGRTGSP